MKRNTLFMKYLCSNLFLTILAFAAIAGLVVPQLAKREREEQIQRARSLLQQQCEWMDEVVIESEKVIYTLMQMPEFYQVSQFLPPYESQEINAMREFVDDFSLLRVAQSDFSNMLLFLCNSQLFLESGTAGTDPLLFYSSRYNQNVKSYEQWLAEIQAREDIGIDTVQQLPLEEQQFILYNAQNSLNGNRIYFMAEFSDNPFDMLLQTSPNYSTSHVASFRQDGSTLYTDLEEADDAWRIQLWQTEQGGQVTWEGEHYTVLRKKLETMPWECVWLLTDTSLNQQAKNTLSALLLMAALLLVGIVLMAAYMAYHNSRPIYALVQAISDRSKSQPKHAGNELEYLSKSFETILGENSQLQGQIDTHMELQKSIFFTKLLNGVVISQQELLAVSNSLGQFFSFNRYGLILVAFQLQEMDEQGIVPVMLKNLLRAFAPGDSYVVPVGSNRFAVILGVNGDIRTQLEKTARQMQKEIPQEEIWAFSCIVGNECELPEQLSREFLCTGFVLESLLADGLAFKRNIVSVQEMKLSQKGYYYPLFEEQSLMNCLIAKKYEEARGLLKKIFKQNYEDRKMPQREKNYFTAHLCSTFSRLLRNTQSYSRPTERYIEDAVFRIRHLEDGKDVWEQVNQLISYLEAHEGTEEEDRGQRLYQEMDRMMESQFQDPDFSIAELARQLKLSENYLSVIYRQYAGCSIASTIEKLRMEFAGNMLKESDAYIKEVCARSGYANLNTFYKAFKRFYGITPSDFRNMHGHIKNQAFDGEV